MLQEPQLPNKKIFTTVIADAGLIKKIWSLFQNTVRCNAKSEVMTNGKFRFTFNMIMFNTPALMTMPTQLPVP